MLSNIDTFAEMITHLKTLSSKQESHIVLHLMDGAKILVARRFFSLGK